MTPIELLQQRANQRSAEFIEQNGQSALIFTKFRKLWSYAASELPDKGLMIECGVWRGRSINFFAQKFPKRTLYGFDSFEGLCESWSGSALQKGSFNLDGVLPKVEDNVVLTKGWVEDTLPPFFASNKNKIAYLHVDTDTYLPAKTILSLAKSRLQKGAIVLFDELIGYPNWELGEYKALTEEIPRDAYEYIAFADRQSAIRIIKPIK